MKRLIWIALFVITCYTMNQWKLDFQDTGYMGHGMYYLPMIKMLANMVYGLCIGGLLHDNISIKVDLKSNITIFVILIVLAFGTILMTVPLFYNIDFINIAIVDNIAPYFQVVLGSWIFFNIWYLISQALKRKNKSESDQSMQE